jgi:hypothetical protein
MADWRNLANSNGRIPIPTNGTAALPATFYLVEKSPQAQPAPDSEPPEIPIEVRRRWMALLIDAVRRAKTLNVNFSDITVSAHDVRAHQVFGYIRITDETMRD